MAQINFGLLDTSIPAQIGALPGNALAMRRQRIQQDEDRAFQREGAQMQNALARMQMTKAQREFDRDDAWNNAISGAQTFEEMAERGRSVDPMRALELQGKVGTLKKADAETRAAVTKQAWEKLQKYREHGLQQVQTPQQYAAWLHQQHTDPELAEVMTMLPPLEESLRTIPSDPAKFEQFRQQGMLGMGKWLEMNQPKPTDLGRLIAERDALPPNDPRRSAYDQAISKSTTHAPASAAPYFTFLPSGEGYLAGNNRTGNVVPVQVNGQAALPASADPSLQGRVAEAKESGKTFGEANAKGQIEFPKVVSQAEETLRLTDELLRHPGFKQAVGASSVLGVQNIPGTAGKDFMVRLDQLKGQQFLQAFESLKGGGQITEVEGKKATDAIARMNNAASEAEFVQATKDFQNVIRTGVERAKRKHGGAAQSSAGKPGGLMQTMPSPSEHRGRVVVDDKTGVRYRSNGSEWVRVE